MNEHFTQTQKIHMVETMRQVVSLERGPGRDQRTPGQSAIRVSMMANSSVVLMGLAR